MLQAIFVGGVPRSGTTFLGSLLGGHSEILCVPEAQFKWGLLEEVQRQPGFTVDQGLQYIREHRQFGVWQLDIDKYDRQSDPDQSNARQAIEVVVRAYAKKIGRQKYQRWVDHCPRNMRYARLLMHAYPEAKFIHLVRDGRAVAASVMPLDWGPNTIVAAAPWWLSQLAFGLAAELEFPERIFRVRYEDLVQTPEVVIKDVCQFLGIAFEPGMLSGTGYNVVAYTRQQHQLVGQPAEVSRAHAWRTSLKPAEIRFFEEEAGGLLEYLGYDLVAGSIIDRLSMTAQVGLKVVEEGRRLWNQLYLHRKRERKMRNAPAVNEDKR